MVQADLHEAGEVLAGLLVMSEPDDPISLLALAEALDGAALLDGMDDEQRAQLLHAAGLARRIAAGEVPDSRTIFSLLNASVTELCQGLSNVQPSTHAIGDDGTLLADFIARALEHLDEADEHLLDLERDPGNRETLDAVFRSLHTIKGMTGFLSLTEIQQVAHEGEALLEPSRKNGACLQPDVTDTLFGVVDQLRSLVLALSDAAGSEAGPSPESRAATTRRVSADTVRVDAARLEQLLDAVGELVIAESMVSSKARVEAPTAVGTLQHLTRLDKLTRQLHEMAGSLRMVPLRPAFQRLARAVRDVAHRADKRVEFVFTGEETELDRAVVDRIEDPLLHLVRNAVDHGIEPTAAHRRAAGKPEMGRVEVRAYHKAGSIYVEVEDDGRGIDRDAILAKANALGLTAPDQMLSERDLAGLIFQAGFSTSETVTDVSGRGVGMDVVKRAVDSLAGQIAIRSEQGKGTTFVIRLPITLAVIDGMAVRVGEDRYIVPTLSVIRSVRPDTDELCTVLGSGEVLQHEDELLRLIRLSEIFDVTSDDRELTESIVMVVEDDGERAGLVIDEILGQQQIVIKSLGDAMGEVSGVSGGAVMPDGRVGLILDVEGLVALANSN